MLHWKRNRAGENFTAGGRALRSSPRSCACLHLFRDPGDLTGMLETAWRAMN